MADSLAILVDPVADTVARVVLDSTIGLADKSVDLHALVFSIAAFISLCGFIGWVIDCFKRKSMTPIIDSNVGNRVQLRTVALMWTAINVIVGGVILVIAKNTSYNALVMLLWGILLLSVLATIAYIVCFVKNKHNQTKETLFSLLDKVALEIIWIFWLVFSGYYVVSELVPLNDLVLLWQNWRDYTSWLIVDFCSIVLIAIKVIYILIKYKKLQK